MRLNLLSVAVALVLVSSLVAGDWPAFRGPNGDGIAVGETGLPVEWSPDSNIKWKTPLPDDGNSSPIVVAGRVFVTCPEENGRLRHLICLDRSNGQELWRQTVTYEQPERTHETNPQCAATAASDGERVVVWYGSAGMHCYDLDGNPLWSRDLGPFDHVWGYGSSPVIHDGRVIQLCGPGERTFLTALNLENGDTIWETPEPGGSASDGNRYIGAWGTPIITQVGAQDQILCNLPTRVAAYDPASGDILWYVTGVSSGSHDLAYTSPVVFDGIAVVMGGFHGPAFGTRLGGTGDVTQSNRIWHTGMNRNPQRIGTGVVVDGHLYMANADDSLSLQCIDIATGEVKWQEPRTSEGAHWGSVIYADGRLYVTGRNGITRVFAPNPEKLETLAENDLGEVSNSTPAVSDGEIFLRTFGHVYCIAEQ
jgi:outer membrane protein assembly factor BamB